MSLIMLRAALGTNKTDTTGVLERAGLMDGGFTKYAADYPTLNPPLAQFEGLIKSTTTAHLAVKLRTVGARALRDEQRELLWTAMKSECSYVQTIVDSDPSRGESLILNAGLVLVKVNLYTKPLLSVKRGTQPGSILCVANLSLLVGTGTLKPNQKKFLNWSYTLDGGKTFISAGSTPGCKTVISNLPPLTLAGVRVSLTNMTETGAWSPVVPIMVL